MSATETQITHDSHYIGGEWVKAQSTERIDVINSTTEQPIGSIPAGTAEEVDAAVAATQQALPAWSAVAPHERAQLLAAVGTQLSGRLEEIAVLVAQELGARRSRSGTVQASCHRGVVASWPADESRSEDNLPDAGVVFLATRSDSDPSGQRLC
jgi:aldehyde dehydrogenase (NAD+)